jgi:hypothetical protein
MGWWIAGGVAVAAIVVLLFWVLQLNRAYHAGRAAVLEHGKRVYGHIVKAEPELSKKNARPLFPYAGIVYTFDPVITNPPDFLREVGQRILAMQGELDLTAEEKEFMWTSPRMASARLRA